VYVTIQKEDGVLGLTLKNPKKQRNKIPNKFWSSNITNFRKTFDPLLSRGYIDEFLIEQTENKKGKFFTTENLLINCQVIKNM
jgi:hypothetical protein